MPNRRRRHRPLLSASWWADQLQDRLPGPLGRIVESARRDDIILLAGSLAFYALVSLVPLVILSLWVTSLALGDERVASVGQRLSQLAPRHIGIETAISQVAKQGTRLGMVAVIVAIWPATAYGSGLERAFLRISPRTDRKRSPMFGRGLLLLVLLPMFVIGTIVASLVGSQILGDALTGQLLGIGLALLAGFAMSFVALVVIYVAFPPERLAWRAVFEASALAALGVSILALLLVLYLSFGANFSQRYATSGMAAVVLLALWLFASNILVLVGYKGALATTGRSTTASAAVRKSPARAGSGKTRVRRVRTS